MKNIYQNQYFQAKKKEVVFNSYVSTKKHSI